MDQLRDDRKTLLLPLAEELRRCAGKRVKRIQASKALSKVSNASKAGASPSLRKAGVERRGRVEREGGRRERGETSVASEELSEGK